MLIPALKTNEFLQWLDEIRHVAHGIQFEKDKFYTLKDCQAAYIDDSDGWAVMPGMEGTPVFDQNSSIVLTSGLYTRLKEMREEKIDIRSYLKVNDHPEKLFIDLGQFEYHKHIMDEIVAACKHFSSEWERGGWLDPKVIDEHKNWIEHMIGYMTKSKGGNSMAHQWFAKNVDSIINFPINLQKPDPRAMPLSIQTVEIKFSGLLPPRKQKNKGWKRRP